MLLLWREEEEGEEEEEREEVAGSLSSFLFWGNLAARIASLCARGFLPVSCRGLLGWGRKEAEERGEGW